MIFQHSFGFCQKKQLFIHFSCTQKCCGWIKAGFSADEIHLHLWWERISCKHKSTPAASSSKSCFWKDYHLPFSEPFSHPEGDGSCLLFWTLLSLHKFCIIRKKRFLNTHTYSTRRRLSRLDVLGLKKVVSEASLGDIYVKLFWMSKNRFYKFVAPSFCIIQSTVFCSASSNIFSASELDLPSRRNPMKWH